MNSTDYRLMMERIATEELICSWCQHVIPISADVFIDKVLTGEFGYWYCSAECRKAQFNSMKADGLIYKGMLAK